MFKKFVSFMMKNGRKTENITITNDLAVYQQGDDIFQYIRKKEIENKMNKRFPDVDFLVYRYGIVSRKIYDSYDFVVDTKKGEVLISCLINRILNGNLVMEYYLINQEIEKFTHIEYVYFSNEEKKEIQSWVNEFVELISEEKELRLHFATNNMKIDY